jgi:hypothetical protein
MELVETFVGMVRQALSPLCPLPEGERDTRI